MDEEFNKEQIERLISSLGPLPESFDNLANAIKNNAAAQTDSGKKVKESGTLFKDVLTHMTEATEDSTESTKKRTAAEKSAFNNSVDALENFGSALTTSHPTLSTFKSTVQSGTDAIADMATQIPLFGEAISMAIKAIGAVTGAYFDQFDQQNAFGSEMRKMGVTVSALSDGTVLTTDKLTDLARKSGYTADKLGELAGIMEGAGPAIALFGSGMTEGTAEFFKYTKLSVANQMQMRQLGYTYEEVNEVQTAYLELQRASGINLKSQNITAETLQKRSLDYAKSLTVISELTGKSAEAQMKDAEAARAEYRNKMANLKEDQEIANLKKQAAVEGISAEQKASLTARAEMLQDEKDARNTMMGTISQILGPDLAKQFNTVAITGNFDATTQGLAQLGMSVEEITESFKDLDPNDATAMMKASAGIIGKMTEGQADAIARFGDSIIRMGDDAEGFGKRMGLGGDQLDAFLRLKDAGDADGVSKMIMEAQKKVTKTKEPGIDYQLTFQAGLEVGTRALKSFSDGLLDKSLPLVIVGTVGAMAALTVATFKGAKALAAMGLPIGKAITGMVSTAASAVKTGFSTAASAVKTGVSGGGDKVARTALTKAATGSKLVRGGGALAAITSVAGGVMHSVSDTSRANTRLESGQIDKAEADRRKTVGRSEGAGQAVGGLAGALAGAQAGAMLGAFGGPVGAAIGGFIGAGVGAWMGSSAGKDAAGAMAGGMTKTIDADVKKAQLALADQSGLYDKKGIGRESTIDWEKFEAMQKEGAMTPEMIQSIIQDNDVSNADEDKLTKIFHDMTLDNPEWNKIEEKPEVPQVEIDKTKPEVPQSLVNGISEISQSKLILANEELTKAIDALNQTIVIADDGIIKPSPKREGLDTKELTQPQGLDTKETKELTQPQGLDTKELTQPQGLDTKELTQPQGLDTKELTQPQGLDTKETKELTQPQRLDTKELTQPLGLDTKELTQPLVTETEISQSKLILANEELTKAIDALNQTIVIADDGIIKPSPKREGLDTKELTQPQGLDTKETKELTQPQGLDTKELTQPQGLDTKELTQPQGLDTKELTQPQGLDTKETKELTQPQRLDTKELTQPLGLDTKELTQPLVTETEISQSKVVLVNEELKKAINALNKTIVVASNGTIVPAFDSGGKLAIGEIGLVGEKGPELVQGPADVTSRAETGKKLSAWDKRKQTGEELSAELNTIKMLLGRKGGAGTMSGPDDLYGEKMRGKVLSTHDTSEEIARLMGEAMEKAGLKGSITAEEVSAGQGNEKAKGSKVEALLKKLENKKTAMGSRDMSHRQTMDLASSIELDDVSTPTVDIAPKEVPKPEETPQGSPQLAGDLDKQDAKADENLRLLADLGRLLGRMDSRMEEQNSLTEKIVQYSSV